MAFAISDVQHFVEKKKCSSKLGVQIKKKLAQCCTARTTHTRTKERFMHRAVIDGGEGSLLFSWQTHQTNTPQSPCQDVEPPQSVHTISDIHINYMETLRRYIRNRHLLLWRAHKALWETVDAVKCHYIRVFYSIHNVHHVQFQGEIECVFSKYTGNLLQQV